MRLRELETYYRIVHSLRHKCFDEDQGVLASLLQDWRSFQAYSLMAVLGILSEERVQHEVRNCCEV